MTAKSIVQKVLTFKNKQHPFVAAVIKLQLMCKGCSIACEGALFAALNRLLLLYEDALLWLSKATFVVAAVLETCASVPEF